MRIDSHHHFWKYTVEEYAWIDESMRTIRRDFLPADLKTEIDLAQIDGVVSVQARQSIEETDWLLSLAEKHDFILGIVGWLPLASPDIEALLERYSEHSKLKSVRHVIQGEPDGFMADKAFNEGLALLKSHELVYDLLVIERQLPEAIALVDRHPNQRFVLDHIAKPLIAQNTLEPWASHLRELAQRENVTCKLSGMVTEADFNTWTSEQLKPYIDKVLEAFGPSRLMFGSDWPVCLVASGYLRWKETLEHHLNALSSSEQQAIWGDVAKSIYRL